MRSAYLCCMHATAFDEIVRFRRSNRKFDPAVPVPDEVIQRSLERAVLSPNSSNMQLWEFHWLQTPSMKAAMVPLCLGQQAASTAMHMVVFVTRQDKWRERVQWHLAQIRTKIQGEPTKAQRLGMRYYGKLMPLIYGNDFFGLLSFFRIVVSGSVGLFRPLYRAGGRARQRIMTHKSCALAAQTFMLSVAAEGYHSCPMEGFDEPRVKRLLGLPRRAEINMVIAVGKGTPAGEWGERQRVDNTEVILRR